MLMMGKNGSVILYDNISASFSSLYSKLFGSAPPSDILKNTSDFKTKTNPSDLLKNTSDFKTKTNPSNLLKITENLPLNEEQ